MKDDDFFTNMAINPKSLENLKKRKLFSTENQPANNGRREEEFAIRRALLENSGKELEKVVKDLIYQCQRHKEKKLTSEGEEVEVMVPADPKCISILFERGFGKVKDNIELSGSVSIDDAFGIIAARLDKKNKEQEDDKR